MNKEKRLKLYNELASIIYNDIKDYVDSNSELTYIEVAGILVKLKKHFVEGAMLNVMDIRIKRDIKKGFKNGDRV